MKERRTRLKGPNGAACDVRGIASCFRGACRKSIDLLCQQKHGITWFKFQRVYATWLKDSIGQVYGLLENMKSKGRVKCNEAIYTFVARLG